MVRKNILDLNELGSQEANFIALTLKYQSVIEITYFIIFLYQILFGSEVRIEGCHPGGLGSMLTESFFSIFFALFPKSYRLQQF